MPSIERTMRDVIKQEVTNLVSEAIRSELKSTTDKFNKILEENLNLRIRVDNLEMQSRSNNLVIHGLPETSYAEAAEDVEGVELRSPRQDTIRAVYVVNCYRISGNKGSRPVFVTFSDKGVRCTQQKKKTWNSRQLTGLRQ